MKSTLTLTLTILATCSLLVSAAPAVLEEESQARLANCASGWQQPQCSSCGGENTSARRRGFCNDRLDGNVLCPCCPKPEKELQCSDCGGEFKMKGENGIPRTVCVGMQEERWSYHGCGCTPDPKEKEEGKGIELLRL